MIWVWLLLSCQFACIPAGLGAFHTQSASWFNKDFLGAYFGYSITYVPMYKRLIVSAPLADNIGQVFSCEIDSRNCTEVPRNINVKVKRTLYDNNYWYGATLKAGQNSFVTCAPLYTASKNIIAHEKNIIAYGTFSSCYRYTDPLKAPTMLISRSDEKNIKRMKIEHSMDSLGWSIDIAGDDKIFIGGPAMNTGRVIRYHNVKKAPQALGGINTNDVHDIKYNFGYSVVIGRFDPTLYSPRSKEKMPLVYAVGSPYGHIGQGKIFFYFVDSNNLKYRGELEGSDEYVVGSLFGAVLCAARLTAGSNATALLVGAPTYARTASNLDASDSFDVGAVFIYQAGKLPLNKLIRKIVGFKSASRFGSAIVSIGDMNGDGMDEIAIGAPYEDDGAGAVYIYSSSDIVSYETEIRAMQRIAPGGRRSFGHSLTALQDYDENGCNELAIGAPETNSVMLLRCVAFLKADLYVNIGDLQLQKDVDNPNRNATHLKFDSCLKVQYLERPKEISVDIKIQLEINHPDAKLAHLADSEYVMQIRNYGTKEQPKCRSIVIATLKGKYNFPIKLKINATQLNSPVNMTDFVPSRVALSDVGVLYLHKSIWIGDCNTTDNCLPDLQLENVEISEISDNTSYVIGSSQTLEVEITIRNKGEMAYNPCMRITIEGSTVEQASTACERITSTTLDCSPSTPTYPNNTWVIKGIFLEVVSLTSANKKISIGMNVFNFCDRKIFKNYTKEINLYADPHGVQIKGFTDAGLDDMVNMTKVEANQEGKAFEQKYTISNKGPTSWVELNATLILQKRSYINNSEVTLYLDDNKQKQCELIATDDFEANYSCKIEKLLKNGITRFFVPMFVQPGTLDAAIAAKENTVYSRLQIDLNGVLKEYSVTTTFGLKAASVPLWVYILAILIGLIILFIFVFVLKKSGFFQRKNKEALKETQTNVKRQTIMRRSMVEGVRLPPGPDRESLLEPATSEPDRRVQVTDTDTSAPPRDKPA